MAASKPMALRLDAVLRVRLARVARRRGTTPSDVARSAIRALIEREEQAAQPPPYDLLRDLIGCVHGGDPGRSAGGGRRVAVLLADRRGRRE